VSFAVTFSQTPEFSVQLAGDNTFGAEYNESITMSSSYNDLKDKPTLNGKTIRGDMDEEDPTVPDWAKQPTKPGYSAEDVGAIPADSALDEADLEYMWDTTEI
jgi:hypothetical protein